MVELRPPGTAVMRPSILRRIKASWQWNVLLVAAAAFLEPRHVRVVGRSDVQVHQHVLAHGRRGPGITPSFDFRVAVREQDSSGTAMIAGRIDRKSVVEGKR